MGLFVSPERLAKHRLQDDRERFMFTCRTCGEVSDFPETSPEVNDLGFYFDCPDCGARNKLVNVATPGETAALVQLSDE